MALMVSLAAPAAAQPVEENDDVLGLARVIEIARSRGPEAVASGARVREAVARLVGARVFATDNPVLEGLAGPRLGADTSPDVEVGLTVPIELGRRSGRVAVARAGVTQAEHERSDARRLAVGAAVVAYYRALHAERRLALAADREALAGELRATVLERQRAGGASQLEVNLAEIELARAGGETQAAQASVARARLDLALVLGLPSGARLRIAGDLADRARLDALAHRRPASARERADVLAARAASRVASAEISAARGAAIPALALSARWVHEEGADAVLGGLALSLPFFEHGQGAAAEASARRAAAQSQARLLETAARAEMEGTAATYAAAALAARRLEALGVPRAIETEQMAWESYRAGRLDLPGLIVIRRDLLDTRREHADRLLDAALAAVDLAVAQGALP